MTDAIGNIKHTQQKIHSNMSEVIERSKSADIEENKKSTHEVSALVGAGLLQSLMDSQNVNTDTDRALSEAQKHNEEDLTSDSAVEGSRRADAKIEYVNLVGPNSTLAMMNNLTITLNSVQKAASIASAKATAIGVDCVKLGTDKSVAAAQENYIGSVASSTLQLSLQAASTVTQVKALNNQSRSLKKNMEMANKLEAGVTNHENTINTNRSVLGNHGEEMPSEAYAAMTKSHPNELAESKRLRLEHERIRTNAEKMTARAQLVNQGSHATKEIIQGQFNVNAAIDQKEAEIDRAQQHVYNEAANTQSTLAKKTADFRSELNKTLDSILTSNNNAVSSIADHIR